MTTILLWPINAMVFINPAHFISSVLITTLLFGIAQSETSIQGQIFCDNYCKVYFNGELAFEDNPSRVVSEFTIDNVAETGIRTFGIWLADNPYRVNEGIWQYESGTFLEGQTDANGDPIVRQFCLGDGAFRGIFTDTECGNEVVVSSDDWKCSTVLTGPRDIEACFPQWESEMTSPTFGGPNDIYTLYDPCIQSANATFGPDFDNPDCVQDFNIDYVDYADRWFDTGYDDSAWADATTYTEAEAVPKLGRTATQLFTECSTGFYCDRETYPESSWGSSEFIWSDALELDNLVLCRYEYESTCSDEASSSTSTPMTTGSTDDEKGNKSKGKNGKKSKGKKKEKKSGYDNAQSAKDVSNVGYQSKNTSENGPKYTVFVVIGIVFCLVIIGGMIAVWKCNKRTKAGHVSASEDYSSDECIHNLI